MALLASSCSGLDHKIHFSSITNTAGSPSAFDPALQRSSSSITPHTAKSPLRNDLRQEDEEDLDDDVDWDSIIQSIPLLPRHPSLPPLPESTRGNIPSGPPPPPLSATPRPFTRPPFPPPLRDKSPVPGLSNTTVLRTCFRIGHLLSEASRTHMAHQDVLFELYARVAHSYRESIARVQHFQFMDLFKNQRPYPRGTLTGWKTGSLLDRLSRAFLSSFGVNRNEKGDGNGDGHSGSRMCRCICRLRKEKNSEIGWVVVVEWIREISWDEIDMMRQIICRD
ncbi:hypothetical protein VTK56DRAFT_9983 [Thermocarpiscus australiensis]